MQHQQSLRIDLGDLKVQIVKKIGVERSKKYFYYLNRLLSQKLSKRDFDKWCYRVLGRENLPLHNQFIRYILRNACQAKTSPPIHEAGRLKSAVQAVTSSPRREFSYKQSDSVVSKNHNVPIWSNGISPLSTLKGKSGIRDRKLRDRPSLLGPNGKAECVSHQSLGTEDINSKDIMENGEAMLCNYQRPMQHVQAVTKPPKNETECLIQRPTEKPRICSKEKTEVDGDELRQANKLKFSTSSLVAPLGIPFCSASVGGARKTLLGLGSGNFVSYYDSDSLSDTETLRKRMEQIAAAQGLGGVSMECANVLNNMLDLYLKRLIRSCVELVGSRSAHEPIKQLLHKHQTQGKVVNGVWPNHLHMRNNSGPMEFMHTQRPQCSISLLDFRIAMELNPQQLGEDWPSLLEKICMQTYEE